MRATLIALLFMTSACKQGDAAKEKTAPSNLIDCAGKKVDPAVDIANCGFCSNACGNAHGSTKCENAACVPTCEAGWAICDGANAGCTRNIKNDPRSCGGCMTLCTGTPCVDGACAADPRTVARDVWGYSITATDDTYLYLAPPNDTPSWSRIKISDGKVEQRDSKKQFAPAAFDGKYLYGCKLAKEEGCELLKRE